MTFDWSTAGGSGGGSGGAGGFDWSGAGSGAPAQLQTSHGWFHPSNWIRRAAAGAGDVGKSVKSVAGGVSQLFGSAINEAANVGGAGVAGSIEGIHGLWDKKYAARAAEDWKLARASLPGLAQNVGNLVEAPVSIGVTAAADLSNVGEKHNPLNIGGDFSSQANALQQGIGKSLGDTHLITPEMSQQLQSSQDVGFRERAKQGGVLGTAFMDFMALEPGLRAGEAFAAGAADAAASDAISYGGVGDVANAARRTADEAKWSKVETRTHNVAHPLEFIGLKTADLARELHKVHYPGAVSETIPGGDAATAAQGLSDLAASAPDAALDQTRQVLGDASAEAASVAAARENLHPSVALGETLTADAKAAETAPVDLKVPPRPGNTPASEEPAADIGARIQAAQDSVPTGHVEGELPKRLAPLPAEAWAARIADSNIGRSAVGRALSHLDTPLEKLRVQRLHRDLARNVEVAQNSARTSPGMITATNEITEPIWHANPEITRERVSRAVAEAIAAAHDGSALVAQFVRDHAQGIDPELEAKLIKSAKRGYDGIPESMLAKLAPEVRAQVEEAVARAADQFRQTSADNLQTLISSRHGGDGLMAALLPPDSAVPLTKELHNLYERALNDERRAANIRRQIPREEARREVHRDQAVLGEVRATEQEREAQRQLGITLETIKSLHDGIVPGLADAEGTADAAIAAATANGEATGAYGATFDVATQTEIPQEGIHVAIGGPDGQFTMPWDQFVATGRDAVIEAIKFPTAADGKPYDAAALWSGVDAHLGIYRAEATAEQAAKLGVPEGSPIVVGDISVNSYLGTKLTPEQATFLGEAYGQNSLWNADTGELIQLSKDPNTQVLYSHYVDQILDPSSRLNARITEEKATANSDGVTMSPQELQNEVKFLLKVDQGLNELHPDTWPLGHFFEKTELRAGVRAPNGAYVPQTVMDMTTHELIQAAYNSLDAEKIQTALNWYYDSHHYVEGLYRGKAWPIADVKTGVPRDAADVFYDTLAVSSVMASPLQNFGRALMAFANFDDLLKAQTDVHGAVSALFERVFKEEPAATTRVENLGLPGERDLGSESKQGTAVAYRWLNTPEFRKLTEGTAMTTVPKYNIIDVLSGRLNLETATAADIAGQYADWTGKERAASEQNFPRANVGAMADTMGFTGPAVDAYKAFADAHDQLKELRRKIAILKKEGLGTPEAIANLLSTYHPADELLRPSDFTSAEGATARSREVTPEQFREEARKGRQSLALLERGTTPPVGLDANWEQIKTDAFNAAQEPDGGVTVRAKTGTPVTKGLAVTTKPAGMETISFPATADRATFDAKMEQARQTFASELEKGNAHLGVFHDGSSGNIEIDPVTVVKTVAEADAIGAATGAKGGAFNFADYNGYFAPHVAEATGALRTQAELERTWKAVKGQERALRQDPQVQAAFEQSIMEYHGSNQLAKLRNFSDNLRNPYTSIGVTLDSVMAQGYGMDKTAFGKSGMYAAKSNEVRSEAAARGVQPHQIQALAWVATKYLVGLQDWGRLLFHHDTAQASLTALEEAVARGEQINPKAFRPFNDWWEEEIGDSTHAQAVRQERADLNRQSKGRYFSADDQALLTELKGYVPGSESTVWVAPERENIDNWQGAEPAVEQTRKQFPDDAKVLKKKEESYSLYRTMEKGWQADIAAGDFAKVRSEMQGYTTGWERPIRGDAEGGSFAVKGPQTVNEPGSSAHTAAGRLESAQYVPPPNADVLHGTVNEVHQQVAGKLRGATMVEPNALNRTLIKLFSGADIGTLLHENLHALKMIATEGQLGDVLDSYPHINDPLVKGSLTPARIAAEEAFVNDLLAHIHHVVRTGEVPPMHAALFTRIASLLEDTYPHFLETQAGRDLPPDIVSFFDRLFKPEIVKPDAIHDPLHAQYVEPPRGVDTKKFRWESPHDYTQRTRQYGEARGAKLAQEREVAQAARRTALAKTAVEKMQEIVNSPTRAAQLADALSARASDTLARIDQKLGNPSLHNTPPAWRNMVQAFQLVAEDVKGDKTGASQVLLREIPTTFREVMKFAAEQGFEPTYVPDMTWAQAQKYLFGHMSLIDGETKDNARAENQGVLWANNAAERSLEMFGAATVRATRELYRGKLVDFIEENYAQNLPRGQDIPRGWKPWNPEKQGIILGRNPATGGAFAMGETMIIPDGVKAALDGMRKPYVDWTFRPLVKVTQPWKMALLALSPAWYIMHFMGALSTAVLEGARLSDYRKVWKQWKTDELPAIVRGRNVWITGDNSVEYSIANPTEGRRVGTVIAGNRIRGGDLAHVARTEGYRVAMKEVASKMYGVVKTVDGLNRAAVYAATLRKGGSPEFAMTRAYESLGDFTNLSPIERGLVTQLFPFYAFKKSMFKILLRLPIDHPYATAVALQLGQLNRADLKRKLETSAFPDTLIGKGFAHGRLQSYGKLNPLVDSYKLMTLDGLKDQINPFIKPLVASAFGAPTFNQTAGMGSYGQLESKPNLLKDYMSAFTESPIGSLNTPGEGKSQVQALIDFIDPARTLTQKQVDALVKRLAKTQANIDKVRNGGYLQLVGNPAPVTPNPFG